MRLLIGIDDTDDLDSPGTGHIAERLASMIPERGWGTRGAITRHQLYVHPDIPYTSHNSSMCFPAEMEAGLLAGFIAAASLLLEESSAPLSDPGLCVAALGALPSPGEAGGELTAFGRRAKVEVLDKEAAYALARKFQIHLSEHGGTGGGVIGALAGVGLRQGGEDGRFRGKLESIPCGKAMSARELLKATASESIRTLEGRELGPDEPVLVGDFLKAVLLSGRKTLLVERKDGGEAEWMTARKETLRRY